VNKDASWNSVLDADQICRTDFAIRLQERLRKATERVVEDALHQGQFRSAHFLFIAANSKPLGIPVPGRTAAATWSTIYHTSLCWSFGSRNAVLGRARAQILSRESWRPQAQCPCNHARRKASDEQRFLGRDVCSFDDRLQLPEASAREIDERFLVRTVFAPDLIVGISRKITCATSLALAHRA
jgi:hypothetical protein